MTWAEESTLTTRSDRHFSLAYRSCYFRPINIKYYYSVVSTLERANSDVNNQQNVVKWFSTGSDDAFILMLYCRVFRNQLVHHCWQRTVLLCLSSLGHHQRSSRSQCFSQLGQDCLAAAVTSARHPCNGAGNHRVMLSNRLAHIQAGYSLFRRNRKYSNYYMVVAMLHVLPRHSTRER